MEQSTIGIAIVRYVLQVKYLYKKEIHCQFGVEKGNA
jgi:hypothetical protein